MVQRWNSSRPAKLWAFLLLCMALPPAVQAQKETPADSTLQTVPYEAETRDLVDFLQFTLNFLGDSNSTTNEKEIILGESYLKLFASNKVQIEDDLEPKREHNIRKDVQAYLKDIDFFFKEVNFQFTVLDIRESKAENGDSYLMVTTDRQLTGISTRGDSINQLQKRYLELNINPQNNDVKVVSMYTNHLFPWQDRQAWWEALPKAWSSFLTDSFSLASPPNDDELKRVLESEQLNLPGLEVADLKPLMKFSALKRLDLSGQKVADLMDIRNLTQLEELNVSNTPVADMSMFRFMPKLKVLKLAGTQVSDLWPVQNFAELELLDVSYTPVKDLSPLAVSQKLKELNCSGCPVTTLQPLAGLAQLEVLKFSGTKVNNLFPLKDLKALKRVDFENTNVELLYPLKELKNLNQLFFSNTIVKSFRGIEELPELQKVYCDSTKITPAEAQKFAGAHPNCLLIFESGELRKWWAALPDAWKNVFGKYVAFDVEPTKEQLHEMSLITAIDLEMNAEIISLEPLKKINNIKVLRCAHTGITELTPLSLFLDMEYLDCAETQVSDLAVIKNFSKLTYLDISDTKTTQIGALKAAVRLETLKCNKVPVADFTSLLQLKNLQSVMAEKSGLPVTTASALMDSLPNCQLIFMTDELKLWWDGLSPDWKKTLAPDQNPDSIPNATELHRIVALENLKLTEKGTRSLLPVQKLYRLRKLEINNVPVNSLAALNGLPNLRELYLSKTAVNKLNELSDMPALRILECAENPIDNLEGINKLEKLEVLNVANTPIGSLDPLEGLKNLKQLNCSGTSVISLKALEGIKSLEHLDCSNTSVFSLGPLYELKLTELNCYNTKLMKMVVSKFKKSNKNCKVLYY